MRSVNWISILAGPLCFCLLFCVLAFFVTSPYYQLILTIVAVWAVMGLSWNLFSGYTGLISFGHAAFFGIGTYAVAISFSQYGLTPLFGILIAAVLGAAAGYVIGLPTFRLRGHYFAMAMLAYPLALLYVFEWLGFQEVSLPMQRESPALYLQFSDQRAYTAVAVGLLLVIMVISRLVEQSRFGRSLLAIKQDEPAAEAVGIDTLRCKLVAIMMSGAIAAAIGGYYAVILLIVTPQTAFGLLTSAQALVVTLFGGIGTVWGPVIGALVLIPLSEILHAKLGNVLPGINGVVFGVAIIGAILFAPEGIYWRFYDKLPRREGAGLPQAAVAQMTPEPSARTQPDGPATANMTRAASSPAAPRMILEVRGLSKSFGGLRAIDNISFSIEAGAVVGIIGPNGAGKTSLFNLLNGFTRPDAGSVLLEGREIIGKRPNAICRSGVGRTFQVVRPFPRMTVLDNVTIGAYCVSKTAAQADALACEATMTVGLQGDAHLPASGLTSRQLRLLELARALAAKPRILLLDETLAGLGAQEVEHLLSVIRQVASTGITIIIIEHTMHAMVRLVDRFIVLDHGTIIATGAPDVVTKSPLVIEAYLGKKWAARA
jgi:ABC-type branched-subunit amino acid transport system ATPase component/ABC-type branched-subunit amino acid transport system permease subunit